MYIFWRDGPIFTPFGADLTLNFTFNFFPFVFLILTLPPPPPALPPAYMYCIVRVYACFRNAKLCPYIHLYNFNSHKRMYSIICTYSIYTYKCYVYIIHSNKINFEFLIIRGCVDPRIYPSNCFNIPLCGLNLLITSVYCVYKHDL